VYGFLKKSNRIHINLFSSVLILLPWLIHLTSGIFPPERALAFMSIAALFSFLCLLEIMKLTWSLVVVLCMIVYMQLSAFQGNYLNWSKILDEQASELSHQLITRNVQSVYAHETGFYYFVPALHYYFFREKKTLLYVTSDQKSVRYKSDANPADFDAVVSATSPDSSYQLLMKVDGMNVYVRPHE
jgi:hypothetical protein